MDRKFVLRVLGLAVVTCALLGAVRAASADIVIETVPVGNAGNAADSTGYGRVDYAYNIGKYEVTAGQYTTFLNAVAATDTYSLFNSNMANTAYGSGITQYGSSGSFSYTVDPASVSRPVNYISFWDACRFANWLNNGQGGAGTTEYGAYTLTSDAITNNTVTRNAGATWAVNSEDEWYKAAYYDPNLNSGAGGYWLYPTRSNHAPGQDMADVSGNNANYYTFPYIYPIDGTHYTTVVGEFQNSDSPYGTFDQGGNVWEWNESTISDSRGLRGGKWDGELVYLGANARGGYGPSFEDASTGFRVVQTIPEPASLGILGFAVVGVLVRRRGLRG